MKIESWPSRTHRQYWGERSARHKESNRPKDQQITPFGLMLIGALLILDGEIYGINHIEPYLVHGEIDTNKQPSSNDIYTRERVECTAKGLGVMLLAAGAASLIAKRRN